jgi:hypothetical protein
VAREDQRRPFQRFAHSSIGTRRFPSSSASSVRA